MREKGTGKNVVVLFCWEFFSNTLCLCFAHLLYSRQNIYDGNMLLDTVFNIHIFYIEDKFFPSSLLTVGIVFFIEKNLPIFILVSVFLE